ncbi:hypothetical protein PM082_010338 [Marasmius tenuissimus]|nr:hypothetical protein PM082_010338 [Marasmius tenuissimus]
MAGYAPSQPFYVSGMQIRRALLSVCRQLWAALMSSFIRKIGFHCSHTDSDSSAYWKRWLADDRSLLTTSRLNMVPRKRSRWDTNQSMYDRHILQSAYESDLE